jgi:hypothetical protein
MTTLKEALYTYLTGRSAVVAALGTRIYPEIAPTEALMPYCVYTQSGEAPVYHMGGAAGIAQASMRLDVFAETEPTRTQVAETVQGALEVWVQGRPLIGSVSVRFVGIETMEDAFVPPSDGSERGVYQRGLDCTIWYKH